MREYNKLYQLPQNFLNKYQKKYQIDKDELLQTKFVETNETNREVNEKRQLKAYEKLADTNNFAQIFNQYYDPM